MKTFLSHIYGAAIALRNRGYDSGLFGIAKVHVPVLSVGNITAGGTGKTPVVELLAAKLLAQGIRIAVVSRGYRRTTKGYFLVSDGKGRVASAREGGDEPVQIARKFPTLVVIADELRSRGCARAVAEYRVDCILLDDAYQHRAMHRDMDIVVIDAVDGIYTQRLLPAGRLREPLENLRRADVLLLSKCEAKSSVEQMRLALSAYTHVPVYATRFMPRALRRLESDEDLPLDTLQGVPAGIFSGIGRPEGFRRTLTLLRTDVVAERAFADHHWYGAGDIAALVEQGRTAGVRVWITTEKDAMRLMDTEEWRSLGDVYYPRMEVEFLDEEEGFDALIMSRLRRNASEVNPASADHGYSGAG